MLDDCPQADRILAAQLTGEARYRAKWRELTGEEEAAAVVALRELSGGRADLVAEVCGVLEGRTRDTHARASPRLGPAVLAAELLGRIRAELPTVGGRGSGSRSWRLMVAPTARITAWSRSPGSGGQAVALRSGSGG